MSDDQARRNRLTQKLADLVSRLMPDILSGAIDTKVGGQLARTANAILRGLEEGQPIHDLESKEKELDAQVAALRK